MTGIDAEPAVLAQAREAAAGRDNLEFAAGDVYALDYPDGAFDVVHAHQVLQHLGEPVAAHVTPSYAGMATESGHATWDDLVAIADGWRAWAAHPDGWFAVLSGEILARG